MLMVITDGAKAVIEWLKRKQWMFRFARVARKWPIERFLPTTDLELSQAERNELTSGILVGDSSFRGT
jgi:hypothetical protein